MSEDAQSYNTFNVSSAEPRAVSNDGVTSNSSNINIATADGNNVSFVNITYTIQPQSLIKKLPPKTILDDVRYIKTIVA